MKFRINIIYKYFLMGCLGALLLISCNPKTGSEVSGDLTVITFDEDSGSFQPVDSFKDISCIQLEMTEESVLGHIKKIIDAEGSLVVLTKDNEVAVFNREDGKYLRHLGSAGEGPEEYIDAQDMVYDPKTGTISVYDRMKDEFVAYRLDGQFAGRKPIPVSLPYVESMERASDGTLLVCNQLAGGLSNPSDYAFTLISPDGTYRNLDPFAPVTVDGMAVTYVKRPMSVCGDEMKLVKFISDTAFSVNNDRLDPLYKLETTARMGSRKIAGEMGYLDFESYCLREKTILGFDKMFETERYLVLIPSWSTSFGYYWIDKEKEEGHHINTSSEVMPQIRMAVQGQSIIELMGSDRNGLISCFEEVGIYKDLFQTAFNDNETPVALPENVVSAIENVDPEGNPFLIIYRH